VLLSFTGQSWYFALL